MPEDAAAWRDFNRISHVFEILKSSTTCYTRTRQDQKNHSEDDLPVLDLLVHSSVISITQSAAAKSIEKAGRKASSASRKKLKLLQSRKPSTVANVCTHYDVNSIHKKPSWTTTTVVIVPMGKENISNKLQDLMRAPTTNRMS